MPLIFMTVVSEELPLVSSTFGVSLGIHLEVGKAQQAGGRDRCDRKGNIS